MSAYREQKTGISDGVCLAQALGQMKSLVTGQLFAPVVHQSAVQLEDYCGKLRPDTAEIVLPRAQVGGAANDIGFKKQSDGTYVAIISAYDSHRYNQAWLADVKRNVLEARAMKKAKTQPGMKLEKREVLANGNIRLSFVQA